MKDRTAVNHNIRKHFNELIYNTARYTEIVLSIAVSYTHLTLPTKA